MRTPLTKLRWYCIIAFVTDAGFSKVAEARILGYDPASGS